MQFYFKAFCLLLIIAAQWTPVVKSQVAPSVAPSPSPSIKPSSPSINPSVAPSKPSIKPSVRPNTNKPSRKPSGKPIHIYGDKEPVFLTKDVQQIIVGVLTILLFVLMAVEFLAPEVLFLIALMIVTGCQIITLTQAFAGL